MSSVTPRETIARRDFRPEDARAIVELHERVYMPEYGMGPGFLEGVQRSIDAALAAGWPQAGGASWLIDNEDAPGLSGSLGLTDEGNGLGRVRWFVFGPELRGRGFGKQLVAELVDEARAQGMRRLELVTFSALTTAAHLYRSIGFRLLSMREREDWGPLIQFQEYGLDLE